MSTETPLLLVLDFVGTVAFALNGALTAVRAERLDIFGVITLGMFTGLGGGKSISRYNLRTYSRFTLPVSAALDGETRVLKASLLSSPARRPLTFDAALAVFAAEQGSYPHVGGTIAEIFLEPALTRMMLLSDRSVGLVSLGLLPTEPVLFDLRSHVIARIDLAPQWVGHECFVVDLEKLGAK